MAKKVYYMLDMGIVIISINAKKNMLNINDSEFYYPSPQQLELQYIRRGSHCV